MTDTFAASAKHRAAPEVTCHLALLGSVGCAGGVAGFVVSRIKQTRRVK